MNVSEIKQLLETEVPAILQESPGFKEWLQDFIRRQTVPKESFDERFDRIMNELAADRENQRRHWDEQEAKWAEQNRMYTFGRKVQCYEKRHQRTADRRIVVSPMVDAKAKEVAKVLNIEVFSHSEDVTELA